MTFFEILIILIYNIYICPICKQGVETEIHVLTQCHLYQPLRQVLFDKAKEIDANFDSMSDENKFIFLLSNDDIVRLTAKTLFLILKTRTDTLYN